MTAHVSKMIRDIPNPVEAVDQVLMLFLMLAAMIVIFKYRDRFFLVLTGDDRVHASVHDACWTVCFKCCNTCRGEWTRCVSAYLCFWHKGLRGRNLVRILGQKMGMVPIPVQVSNLVVGDLPTGRIGHYYIKIEAGESPPQTSSVAEDAQSRLVPFNRSRFVIRIRNSRVEEPVHFTVMELHTLGHTRLCECFIHPTSLLEWASQHRGPMRFKMESCQRGAQKTIPSWLLLEVTPQREFGSPSMSDFSVSFTESRTGIFSRFQEATDFKGTYALVDTRGADCAEPPQRVIEDVDRLKRKKSVWLGIDCGVCCTVFGVVFVCFALAHVYTFSCYRGFMKLKVLSNHSALPTWKHVDRAAQVLVSCNWNENPIEVMLFEDFEYVLQKASREAHELFKKHAKTHPNLPVKNYRCHPSVNDEECAIVFPDYDGCQRPTMLAEYMPIDIRCFSWSCPTHRLIEQIRHYVLLIIIIWTAMFLCARNFMDEMIKKRQRHLHGARFMQRPLHLLDGSHNLDHGEKGTLSAQPMLAQAFSYKTAR